MLKKALLIFVTLLAVLIVGAVSLMSSTQFNRVINWHLPQGWQASATEGIRSNWQGISLADFQLNYQDCPLLQTEGFRLQWAPPRQLAFSKISLDYQCLSQLPASEEQSDTPFSVKALLALLPEGEAKVARLEWRNLPETMSPRLKALLASPSQLQLAFFQQKLTASLRQQAIDLSVTFANQQLIGSLRYQPSGGKQHHEAEQHYKGELHQLQFSAKLDDNPLSLPLQLKLDYQWKLPPELLDNPDLQQGQSQLAWQKEGDNFVGDWSLRSQNPQYQLALPFRLTPEQLEIQQGKFNWDLPAFPLQGFVNATFRPAKWSFDQLFPLQTYLRFSLLSQNEYGKGNIVIENKAGEIRENALNLPLQITGNIKYGNFVLYSTTPLAVAGNFDDIKMRFLPSALIRVTGQERYLTIKDLRFPLAGIRVDKYGINGRLQAIFKGESPDFKQIELHLDGYANNFKAGKTNLFEKIPDKTAIDDRWQWRFWGNSTLQAVKSQLKLAGRGDWRAKLVQLSEFKGDLAQIRQNGVNIPHTSLNLTEPIKFAYQTLNLSGAMALNSPAIHFDYGGELLKPTASVKFNGNIENLNLQGLLSAGQLGPLKIFARRQLSAQSSDLIGRLYWLEQPASVFQSLFPFRQKWLITAGTIRGETAFSLTQQGLTAGGHFAIRDGAVSMPSGELNGIHFSLPYQLKKSQLSVGLKRPIEVRIDQINVGLPIQNARMKVYGNYPYSKRNPLILKQLSMDLLGGKMEVAQFALPQTQQAYFKLSDIQLEQILALAQYQQIDLKGRINATFPFWLSGKPCYVCDGLITQAERSSLKFTPELLKAMQQSGYTEQILTYLVNDSQVNQLQGLVNVGQKGEMVLNTQLKLVLNQQQKAKINLNYNHRENLFELWKLINYGSDFEQKLEHWLYQQLDRK